MTEPALGLQLLYRLQHETVGRRRLAHRVGRTEMVVRKALDELRAAHLIQVERDGLRWTQRALNQYGDLMKSVRSVRSLLLDLWGVPVETLIAHLGVTPRKPAWALRDDVLAQGAEGLVLLTFESGLWRFSHNDEPLVEKNPADARALGEHLVGPQEGDALLLVRAPAMASAEHSLWTAIADTLDVQTI